MKRHQTKDLLDWYKKGQRKPLILRGARQVGKSTLVRLFCEENQIDLLEINIEREKLKSVESSSIKMNDILDEIQLKSQKKIQNNKTLIFFDEIQEQPSLLKFLRYFYEERPDLAVISAGSLLEVALKEEKFSFPVGRVEFMHLGPMTFSEFLLATNNELLLQKIQSLDFSNYVMDLAQEQFRLFLYIGGMPQAIRIYVEEKSLFSVRAIQEQILQTYIADFPKYNVRINFDRIQRIFASTVTQLGKKIIYQRLDPNSQSREVRRTLELLLDARVLLSCIHSDGNSVPLLGESDSSVQKIYFLDVGLANCWSRIDLDVIDSELKNHFNTKGMIAEQFVAQHLAYMNGSARAPELFYWLRDRGIQKGEIDFLVEQGQSIIPVEVKATAAGHMKSLFYFVKEKKAKKAIKLSLEGFKAETVRHKIQEENITCNLTTLPIWAVEMLYRSI